MEKTRHRKEFLVGLLVLLAGALLVVFGWLMGVIGPFGREIRFHVLYNFVGGVELGSPVRVAGVKAGKVERIEFLRKNQSVEAVQITLSVSKHAATHVRKDSRFYINMAGLIGERYVEVSPGSMSSPELLEGSIVRGVDPPRIDQLLSQGYDMFGKIIDFWEENEKDISEMLTNLHRLIADANRLLKTGEVKKFASFIDNLNSITGDMKTVTKRLKTPEADEVFDKLYEMIRRAHEVDKRAIKKFFQEEGIRSRIF